eukprot:282402-Rhodomonas_salina.4
MQLSRCRQHEGSCLLSGTQGVLRAALPREDPQTELVRSRGVPCRENEVTRQIEGGFLEAQHTIQPTCLAPSAPLAVAVLPKVRILLEAVHRRGRDKCAAPAQLVQVMRVVCTQA